MQKVLSWKILLGVIFCIVLGVCVFFILQKPKNTPLSIEIKQKPTSENAAPLETEQNLNSLDSDHDGLKDWEEVLWKTDPHNPDTDGDGTPDGEEVAEGRDPMKKGPKDSLENPSITQESSKKSSSYEDYFKTTDQNSPTINPILPQIPTTTAIKTPLQPPTDGAKQALHDYGNSAGKILKNLTNQGAAEATIFADVIKNPSSQGFTALSGISKKYADAAKAFDALTPPESIKNEAKSLSDAYKNQSQAIALLAGYQSSGSIPPQSLIPYTDTVLASGKAIISFSKVFKTQKISFTSTEDGALFSSVY